MRFLFVRCLLCMSLMIPLICPAHAEEESFYIRIIANSNAPTDQMQKHYVRFRILSDLMQTDTPFTDEKIEKIKQFFSSCPCKISRCLWSPSPSLPQKESLIITLGKGQGHNWWGILYAPAQDAFFSPDIKKDIFLSEDIPFHLSLWHRLLILLGFK